MVETWLDPELDVATRLRVQARYCERLGSPFYADLLERAAADAEAGDPVHLLG